MTEDSENPERGHGSFHEGAELTGQTTAPGVGEPPTPFYIPSQRPMSDAPHFPGTAPTGPRPYITRSADVEPTSGGPDKWSPGVAADIYATSQPSTPASSPEGYPVSGRSDSSADRYAAFERSSLAGDRDVGSQRLDPEADRDVGFERSGLAGDRDAGFQRSGLADDRDAGSARLGLGGDRGAGSERSGLAGDRGAGSERLGLTGERGAGSESLDLAGDRGAGFGRPGLPTDLGAGSELLDPAGDRDAESEWARAVWDRSASSDSVGADGDTEATAQSIAPLGAGLFDGNSTDNGARPSAWNRSTGADANWSQGDQTAPGGSAADARPLSPSAPGSTAGIETDPLATPRSTRFTERSTYLSPAAMALPETVRPRDQRSGDPVSSTDPYARTEAGTGLGDDARGLTDTDADPQAGFAYFRPEVGADRKSRFPFGRRDARTSQAAAGQAATSEAGEGQARAGQAATSEAGAGQAGTGRAATSESETSQAGTSQAGTSQAGTSQPGARQARASRAKATQDVANQAATTGAATDVTATQAAAKQDAAPHTTDDGGRPSGAGQLDDRRQSGDGWKLSGRGRSSGGHQQGNDRRSGVGQQGAGQQLGGGRSSGGHQQGGGEQSGGGVRSGGGWSGDDVEWSGGSRDARAGSTGGGSDDAAASPAFGSSRAEGIGGFVFDSSTSKTTSGPDQTWGDEVWSNYQTPPAADSFGLPATGRRIEPSPPRQRSRLIPGLLIGLLVGLLLFGSAGWFVGRTWTKTATPAAGEERTATPTGTASAAPSPTLGIFEQSQIDVNRPDFANSALGTISEGWLPYLSNCSRSGRGNGPALGQGEKVRVRCTLDGMTAIFVEYRSNADRDRARTKMISTSVGSLAPGIESAPDQRSAPSGRTEGNYVEYAFRLTEQGTTRTVNGMWWDDAKTPIAGYLLAFWKEGLGERWEPMRDLWSRYA